MAQGAIGKHCFFVVDMNLEHQYPGDYTSKLASNQAGIKRSESKVPIVFNSYLFMTYYDYLLCKFWRGYR